MNVCTNAMHAMKGLQGVLELSEETVEVGSEIVAVHPQLHEGTYLRLSIRDTGCGMSPDTLQHLFEPFYTTKGPGEGTGLGLSVVHGIMQNHGGAITVYSQQGKGSVFHLYFPAVAAPNASLVPVRKAARLRGRGQRVLLIDDEEMIARTARTMLQRLGYEVSAYTNPSEAMEEFASNPSTYHLILSDLTMPIMSGLEVAERVRALRTEIPFILASGYLGEKEQEIARSLKISRLITKPISLDVLAETLAECLSEKAGNLEARS